MHQRRRGRRYALVEGDVLSANGVRKRPEDFAIADTFCVSHKIHQRLLKTHGRQGIGIGEIRNSNNEEQLRILNVFGVIGNNRLHRDLGALVIDE